MSSCFFFDEVVGDCENKFLFCLFLFVCEVEGDCGNEFHECYLSGRSGVGGQIVIVIIRWGHWAGQEHRIGIGKTLDALRSPSAPSNSTVIRLKAKKITKKTKHEVRRPYLTESDPESMFTLFVHTELQLLTAEVSREGGWPRIVPAGVFSDRAQTRTAEGVTNLAHFGHQPWFWPPKGGVRILGLPQI